MKNVPYREPTRTKEHDSLLLSKICRWHSGQNAQRESTTDFLQVLNSVHPSLSFTMELEHEDSIPFFGTVITRCGNTLKQKCTENQLTRDFCFIFKAALLTVTKKGLVNTMVDRAYRLSSTEETFTKECDKSLQFTLSYLSKISDQLIVSAKKSFLWDLWSMST